jgi:predicted phage terminase large subunit-like protein
MLLDDKKELERLKRVHRAEVDNAYFCMEYLSDHYNPEYTENIIRNGDSGELHQLLDDLAPIHREFFDLCDYVDEHSGSNLAIAAPRGHSKSGIFSNAFVLKGIVFRQLSHRYVLVISETDNLSKKLIGWVNKTLKFNKKIIEDFGVLMHEQNTKNEKDNEEAFITTTNFLIEASSSGKQLRGKRHGALRPTTCLIDDPSSTNNEGTKEAREKLIEWFNGVVVPIGSKGTNIILVGTMVSSTGLLNHVLKRKDFKPSFHDAIVSEPDHPDMWEEYIDLYLHAEEDGAADKYYEQHKDHLESGVTTAWEWRWTYRELMHRKANMGTKSFNSEYRNRAYSEDEKFFFVDQYADYYFTISPHSGLKAIMFEGEEIPLHELTISGAWDLALGKNARSCYNSCVTVGRHEKTGRIFVLDEYASKEPPHKFMEGVIARIREWRHHIFSVETINAYHEFYRQLQEELRMQSIYTTKVQDIKAQQGSKDKRIESLEPYFANRTLVLNRAHKMLIQQLDDYPFGDYVDSADALQIAVEHVARPRLSVQDKPYWL